ncbi:hypothetical protein BASA81_008270 [Batrachochytrium salamandrivorans]|nr:hypothetical protein BASA81_008270 [Batrachochytrium salamandrivorans]
MRKKLKSSSSKKAGEVVDIVTVPANSLPKLSEGELLLASLIAPLPVERFIDSILHRKVLAVCGNGPKRFEKFTDRYFESGDTLRLLETTASESISIWLPTSGATTGSLQVDSFKSNDAVLAQRLFESNQASLYFRASEETCELLTKQVLEGLGWPLGVDVNTEESKGEVEVFLGNARNATPTHTDFQHNFTIQLVGSKRWRFKRGDLANPLAAKSTHFANTPDGAKEVQLLLSSVCGGKSDLQPPEVAVDGEGWEEVELQAGDVLYHPPGIWHNVSTSSQTTHSLSCNISLVSPNWADVIASAVKQLLWSHALFRQPVAMRDYAKMTSAITLLPNLLCDAALGIGALQHTYYQKESEIEWDGSIVAYALTTNFRLNPLAAVLFDTDAFADDEEEDGDTFNCIVSTNIGASTPMEIEPMSRVQVTNLPRSLLSILTQLRPPCCDGKRELTGKELAALCGNNHKWQAVARVLVGSGWWLLL